MNENGVYKEKGQEECCANEQNLESYNNMYLVKKRGKSAVRKNKIWKARTTHWEQKNYLTHL